MINVTEKILSQNKEESNCDYMDAEEYYISQYVKSIEDFINNYGYSKEICSIDKNASVKDIEDMIKNFMITNANSWNYLEIFGTLKDIPDRDIFVCCYEPYGDELFCIEKKDNKLFFFKYRNRINNLNFKHINYLQNL